MPEFIRIPVANRFPAVDYDYLTLRVSEIKRFRGVGENETEITLIPRENEEDSVFITALSESDFEELLKSDETIASHDGHQATMAEADKRFNSGDKGLELLLGHKTKQLNLEGVEEKLEQLKDQFDIFSSGELQEFLKAYEDIANRISNLGEDMRAIGEMTKLGKNEYEHTYNIPEMLEGIADKMQPNDQFVIIPKAIFAREDAGDKYTYRKEHEAETIKNFTVPISQIQTLQCCKNDDKCTTCFKLQNIVGWFYVEMSLDDFLKTLDSNEKVIKVK